MKIRVTIQMDEDTESIINLDNWYFVVSHMTIFVIWVWLNAIGSWNVRWDLYPLLMVCVLLSWQIAYTREKVR